MKQFYFLLLFLMTTVFAFAQSSDLDNNGVYTATPNNTDVILSGQSQTSRIVNHSGGPKTVTPCTSTPVLSPEGANSCDSASLVVSVSGGTGIYNWWDAPVGGNCLQFGTDSSYVTGMIDSSITYYVQSICYDSVTNNIPLAAQTSTYSGGTRGYWFTAPTDFLITGFYVPTTASSGTQNVEILVFDTVPPFYSTVTNDFDSKGYWNNYGATDTIPACIPIKAGQIIGILGTRGGTVNSYLTAPTTTTIGGATVTLTRLGFQDDLSVLQAYDIWQEASGSISRVEFFYSLASNSSAMTPVTANIGVAANDTLAPIAICNGEAANIFGNFEATAGFYSDTLLSATGCDSIQIQELIVNNSSSEVLSPITACMGSSLLIFGEIQTMAGTYYDTLVAANNCDSIISQELIISMVDTLVSVDTNGTTLIANASSGTIEWIDCNTGLAIPGENSTTFDPPASGSYAVQVTQNGCTASSICYSVIFAGINNELESMVTVYPNPAKSQTNIDLGAVYEEVSISVFDMTGRRLSTALYNNRQHLVIDTDTYATGVYQVLIQTPKGKGNFKLIKD